MKSGEVNQLVLTPKRWTEEKVTGSLLVAGLLIGLLAVVIMIAGGAAPGFAAVGGNLEAMAPYADTFRLLNGMYTVAWIFLPLGFGLLARLWTRTWPARWRNDWLVRSAIHQAGPCRTAINLCCR